MPNNISHPSRLHFLYDDGDIFALDKPAGIHSVMQRSSHHPSIAEALLIERPTLAAAAPTREDAGLVNRLDHDTSGILLGATTKNCWQSFSKLLKASGIKKEYLVILEGTLTNPSTIRGWIGSPYRRGSKVRVYDAMPPPSVRALAATTTVYPLYFDSATDTTLARVDCAVARRHQVRAHCAAMGFPLLGDSLYGATRTLSVVAPPDEQRLFFLHAGVVDFLHPLTQKKIYLTASAPAWALDRYHISR